MWIVVEVELVGCWNWELETEKARFRGRTIWMMNQRTRKEFNVSFAESQRLLLRDVMNCSSGRQSTRGRSLHTTSEV